MTVFGDATTPDDVIGGLEQHIRLWGRAYWDWAAQGRGFSRRLPSIVTYRRTNELPERWTGDGLPTLVLVAEDPLDPSLSEEGVMVGRFPAGIAIVVASSSQENANRLASTYGVGLAALLNQKTNLGPVGLDDGEIVDWLPFDSGDLQSEMVGTNKRMLAAVSQGCVVQVPMFSVRGGPTVPTPDTDPPAPDQDFSTADTVVINLDEEQ